MRVDSFAYLPRSFRAMYERAQPLPEERAPVWAPFERRLAEAAICLVSSAGLHVEGQQPPFDADRERREPGWGDPSWRAIPGDAPQGSLGMTHLHVNNEDILTDHEVALPMRALRLLADAGTVGRSCSSHVSVMGYQEAGLEAWRRETAPEIIEHLRAEGADGVVLAPV